MDEIKIVKVRDVKTPTRGTPKSAGLDFYIPNDCKSFTLSENESITIPSGIHAVIPESKALIAFNKSGIASKYNIIVGACVIDEDYQGEIHLNVINVSKDNIRFDPGVKLVQLLLVDVSYAKVTEVATLEELYASTTSIRGTGGFGSTGTK